MRGSVSGRWVAEMTNTGMLERKEDSPRAFRNASPSTLGIIQSRRMAQGATPWRDDQAVLTIGG